MKIGGLQKLTLIDFPSKIACGVFLAGCNFRCPFCYNPYLVIPTKIKTQPKISEKNFFNFLKKRKNFLEAVVITGGEPTIQKDLSKFIKEIKKLGYLIKLDTNGYRPEILKRLIKENLIDYIAMDVKAPLNKKIQSLKNKNQNNKRIFNKDYEKMAISKIDLKKIKESIELIKNSEIEYEFRTTIIPIFHTKTDIIQIVKEISPAKRYFLQNFNPKNTLNPKFQQIKPYSDEYLLKIQKEINHFFEICQIRS